MEGKRLNRKRLKWRNLKNISLILAVSMIISTMAGFWYFQNVVKTKRISDEESRLLQIFDQLAFVREDTEQFSRSILIDEELQNFLEEKDDETGFHRQRRFNQFGNRLRISLFSEIAMHVSHVFLKKISEKITLFQ